MHYMHSVHCTASSGDYQKYFSSDAGWQSKWHNIKHLQKFTKWSQRSCNMLKKTKGKARQSGAVCVVKKSHPVTLEAGLVWVVATIPYHTGWWLCSPCRMRPPALRRSQIWTPWKWWPIRVTLICLFCLFWLSLRLGLTFKCFFLCSDYLFEPRQYFYDVNLSERERPHVNYPATHWAQMIYNFCRRENAADLSWFKKTWIIAMITKK